jgi:5'-methylthioadenosine phosphorylase
MRVTGVQTCALPISPCRRARCALTLEGPAEIEELELAPGHATLEVQRPGRPAEKRTFVVAPVRYAEQRLKVAPGHVVVPDQFIDRTAGRVSTFFDDGVVAHVSMADPVCPHLASALATVTRATGATVHEGGTYVCIEGPRFSTRAESHLFRQWGATVIGMTNVPEAFLAREAELPYATMALSTDYDCWRDHDHVEVNDILAVLHANVSRAQEVVRGLAAALPDPSRSPAQGALQYAVLTKPQAINAALRDRFGLLLGKYW